MLFGTDGIRGEVVDSPSDDEEAISQLLDDRMISSRLMRVVGEALTRVAGMDNTVIIGWDDRPRNGELVAASYCRSTPWWMQSHSCWNLCNSSPTQFTF